ncbi:hypothetical protein NDI56_17620 [Haloarcula sp. S1CR25-12]|uniref:Uncharacterized protein n=1 Tax=Haloarcula saliterrae TaxID=2950534 RepID=A0ABU2FG34_9EURY|nr:hypothetical protein [Haloarcula sp. S1CR25-12]MDS0261222.1 hypothetical protein [Haloarcula sp. S1CR25-12]
MKNNDVGEVTEEHLELASLELTEEHGGTGKRRCKEHCPLWEPSVAVKMAPGPAHVHSDRRWAPVSVPIG